LFSIRGDDQDSAVVAVGASSNEKRLFNEIGTNQRTFDTRSATLRQKQSDLNAINATLQQKQSEANSINGTLEQRRTELTLINQQIAATDRRSRQYRTLLSQKSSKESEIRRSEALKKTKEAEITNTQSLKRTKEAEITAAQTAFDQAKQARDNSRDSAYTALGINATTKALMQRVINEAEAVKAAHATNNPTYFSKLDDLLDSYAELTQVLPPNKENLLSLLFFNQLNTDVNSFPR
jgi:chromosome segregation ATPase